MQVQSPTCLEVGCGTGFVITSLARILQARNAQFMIRATIAAEALTYLH